VPLVLLPVAESEAAMARGQYTPVQSGPRPSVKWFSSWLSDVPALPAQLLTDAHIAHYEEIVPNTIVTDDCGTLFLVVLRTDATAQIMHEVTASVLQRTAHRNDIVDHTDSAHSGTKVGAGWRLNPHSDDGCARYADTDGNVARREREELNIRAAADSLCGELSVLPPLQNILHCMGTEFEDAIGPQAALKVTEISTTGIFHQVFCTSGGYAAAPRVDRGCEGFTVASFGEVHGGECSASDNCLAGCTLFVGNCRVICNPGVVILYR
jgi:hypothetical protein